MARSQSAARLARRQSTAINRPIANAVRVSHKAIMKLARYLAFHSLTQVQFAAAVGVSRVCVNHWVNERKVPLARQMIAIYRATGGDVSADDFPRQRRVNKFRLAPGK